MSSVFLEHKYYINEDNTVAQDTGSIKSKFNGVANDQKARLVVKDIANTTMFDEGILQYLRPMGGVVFPYSPTIQISHGASYGAYDTPHSIYQSQYFAHTTNPTISLQATFTAQDTADMAMSAAALQFFKSATKMDFGRSAKAFQTAGAPPPVLLFSAYGALHFKNTPVVVTSFNYALTESEDYVSFEDEIMGVTSVPVMWLASLELQVQVTPTRQKDFDLRAYRSGALLNSKNGGWA